MKFIVDAQLPQSLSRFLRSKGFDAIHTIELTEKNKTKDDEVARICTEDERILITKDNDFLESFLLKQVPPKLIMVTTGNIPNAELLLIFSSNLEKIVSALEENSLIEINKAEIVIHE